MKHLSCPNLHVLTFISARLASSLSQVYILEKQKCKKKSEVRFFVHTIWAILSAESYPSIWPIATKFLSWLCLCRIKYFTLFVMFTTSRLSGHLGLKSLNTKKKYLWKSYFYLNGNTYAIIITTNMFAISVAKTWITIICCHYNYRTNHHQNPYK